MRVIKVVFDQRTLSGLLICDKPGDWDPRINRTVPYPKSMSRGRYGAERYRHMVTALARSLWPHWFSWPGELPRGGDTCARLLKGKFTKERQTRTFQAAYRTCRQGCTGQHGRRSTPQGSKAGKGAGRKGQLELASEHLRARTLS